MRVARKPSRRSKLRWLATQTGRQISGVCELSDMAEARLLIAVIDMAARDLCADPDVRGSDSEPPRRERIQQALRFFRSPTFTHYCGLLGLEPEWVRQLAYGAAERTAQIRCEAAQAA